MSEKSRDGNSPEGISTSEENPSKSREAEEKRRESEQLFRSLTENSLAAVFIVQDGKFRYINTSAIAYAGYTAEELIGRDSDVIVHPDDKEMVKKKARDMLQGRDATPYEFRMVTKQGAIRFIIQIVSSIQYNAKPAILANAIDVTERKETEEALRESERRLADIIDFLPDATLAIDRQGKVIAWNHAIEEMTGVKAPDMLGKGDYEYALPFYGIRRPILLDLVLKPDKKIERSYYSILEKKKDLLIVETWVPFLRWRSAFLWAKARPLYDSKGDIVGAIESIRDITERKQLEELLRTSEEKYRQLFTTVPDAIFMFDAGTRQFIDANESALRLYGCSRDEFLKMTLADITAEPEESEKVVKKTMAVRMDWVPLRYHRKKDKTVFPVEASTSMFDLGGRNVICVVIRDITDRRRTEETIKESEERHRTLFESTANPILVIDTEGNYINGNNSALRFFECTQDELLSKNVLDFMPPDRKQQVLDIQKPLWQSGGSVETEYHIHGSVKFMELTVTPTTRQGKNVILGIGKDITKRKQAEEKLRESERRLADIIDFLPDATLAIDRQGKVIAWNRAIEEMTGVKAVNMLGNGDYEYALPFYAVRRPILIDLVLKPDKDIERSYYSILNKQKDLLIVETWVPYLKEKRAFLWAKASPLYDGRGDIVGAIESIRDITERKQAEEVLGKREMELEAKTHELEDLNAALRVLLKQRDEDKNELEQKVLSNVKMLILPHMEKLKSHVDL
ncbi:MAG: PAS domain S-box protein, partial [Deltaproteobacteria bacterium]|nr:PAS domain S-box protein [Deltaproteobacteria bacterium]